MTPQSLDSQRKLAAEVVALTMMADGILANRELDALDRLEIPALLGVARDQLIQAIIDQCHMLLAQRGRSDSVRLLDIERFEAMLDRITDPALREVTCRAMLVLAKADGSISVAEQTLLRTALTRWNMSLDVLASGE